MCYGNAKPIFMSDAPGFLQRQRARAAKHLVSEHAGNSVILRFDVPSFALFFAFFSMFFLGSLFLFICHPYYMYISTCNIRILKTLS